MKIHALQMITGRWFSLTMSVSLPPLRSKLWADLQGCLGTSSEYNEHQHTSLVNTWHEYNLLSPQQNPGSRHPPYYPLTLSFTPLSISALPFSDCSVAFQALCWLCMYVGVHGRERRILLVTEIFLLKTHSKKGLLLSHSLSPSHSLLLTLS